MSILCFVFYIKYFLEEKADQETSEMLKELEKKLFEKYLTAVHDAFKVGNFTHFYKIYFYFQNIDPNTKFVDLLNTENAEEGMFFIVG